MRGPAGQHPRPDSAGRLHVGPVRTSPVRVGLLAPLDVVVVVAVVNYLALVVEAQQRHPGERQFLAPLGPTAPPFDCRSVTGDDRLAEPALDVLLGRKVLAEVAVD